MEENNLEGGIITNCVCPICKSTDCKIEVISEPKSESRVCENCGYMTLDAFKVESPHVAIYEQTTAKIVVALKYEDKDLGQYWYPSTLFIPGRGAIYPLGTEKNWKYGFAKVIPVPIHQRLQYPIPGKTDEYYEQRLDVENTKQCLSFKEAMSELMSIIQ